MYSTRDGERMATEFLAKEPDYDEPAWIDAYANVLGSCRPSLSAEACSEAARQAYKHIGGSNPKIAAMLEVAFGKGS